jgi:hypothetical protein
MSVMFRSYKSVKILKKRLFTVTIGMWGISRATLVFRGLCSMELGVIIGTNLKMFIKCQKVYFQILIIPFRFKMNHLLKTQTAIFVGFSRT